MSTKSTHSTARPFASRVLFGLAAVAMLLQSLPWNGGTWVDLALGISGSAMFALMALADRKDHVFLQLATVAAVIYIPLAAVKLLGIAA